MPIETILRPILDTVLDAVIVMDRDGVVRAWNRHAESIFGWTAEEALGRDLGGLIVPEHLRGPHQIGVKRFNATGERRVLDRRIEISGLRKDGSEIPVELSVTMVSRDGRDVFVGFLRDISERRRAEEQLAFQVRESRLMFELSELASREFSVDEALTAALDAICELAGWPVGHAFHVGEESGSLRSGPWSSSAAEVAPRLVETTAEMTFSAGVGLPGRVVASGKPLWISRTSADANFPRRNLGFHSGFAFPVLSGGRCIAVLEFFSRDEREPDASMLLSARAIGAQVGRVFERKRAEELQGLLLAELNHRAKNILAVVRGMAHLSFSDASDVGEAQRLFDRRLDSVAKANDLLQGHSGKAAVLGEIVEAALAGCGIAEDRVSVSGPELCIDSQTAITVALAVHELATNAFKYGALSVDGGRVDVCWSERQQGEAHFDFEWVESGGPAVSEPQRKGFGTRILTRAMESSTGGKAEMAYVPEGFQYRVRKARHSGPPGGRAGAA